MENVGLEQRKLREKELVFHYLFNSYRIKELILYISRLNTYY